MKKQMVGIVKSDRMDKTIVVEAERLVRVKLYGKKVKRTSRFKAHDEKNEAKAGDRVLIVEHRPISRTKRWCLSGILERAEK